MINVVITLYWQGFIQAILLSVDGKKGTHSFNSVLKLSLCHTRKLNPFFKTDCQIWAVKIIDEFIVGANSIAFGLQPFLTYPSLNPVIA